MANFSVDDRLIDMPVNFLTAPRLRCHKLNTKAPKAQHKFYTDWIYSVDASWNLMNTRFWLPGQIDSLNVFNIDYVLPNHGFRRQHMIENMTDRLVHHGLNSIVGAFWSGRVNDLDTFWTDPQQAKGQKTTLVALSDPAHFRDIKRKADLLYGVQTVCALPSKISYYAQPKGFQPVGYQNQHLDNLAMKFNMKTGGCNFALDPQKLQDWLKTDKDTTVVFGADVGHPPIGSFQGMPSVAVVFASWDPAFQNYPASMRLQAGGQEASQDLNDKRSVH
jgi:hypothetical protein